MTGFEMSWYSDQIKSSAFTRKVTKGTTVKEVMDGKNKYTPIANPIDAIKRSQYKPFDLVVSMYQ